MKTDVLITVLSWEDRYLLGLVENIKCYSPSEVFVIKYSNPLTESWKSENLKKTKEILGSKLKLIEIDSNNQKITWELFRDEFGKKVVNKNVVVDITTMPRESIWFSLFNSNLNNASIKYVYYKPQSYSGDWISRNAGKPRLLYKMSGIAKLGVPTLLIITGGYDIQRLDSLIFNFEPKKTILLLHDGEDDRNNENFDNCKDILSTKYNIEPVKYDSYNVESSYKLLKSIVESDENGEKLINQYNIILNSLGPKISSVSLFKLWMNHQELALSYIPSREYNKDYSLGIGEKFEGEIL